MVLSTGAVILGEMRGVSSKLNGKNGWVRGQLMREGQTVNKWNEEGHQYSIVTMMMVVRRRGMM